MIQEIEERYKDLNVKIHNPRLIEKKPHQKTKGFSLDTRKPAENKFFK